MKLVNQISLARGAMLVDFAFSRERQSMDLEAADLIGIVAAFISRGNGAHEIEEQLSRLLAPEIGIGAQRTFDMFEDRYGRALWAQGPAKDDVEFTNPKLQRFYPDVGLRL